MTTREAYALLVSLYGEGGNGQVINDLFEDVIRAGCPAPLAAMVTDDARGEALGIGDPMRPGRERFFSLPIIP